MNIISYRKNRNLYAQLLLHMVKRGLVEEPFTRRPEAGPLQALPSYMVCPTISIHFKWTFFYMQFNNNVCTYMENYFLTQVDTR